MGIVQVCLLLGAVQAFLLALGLSVRTVQKQGNPYFVGVLLVLGTVLLSKFLYTPARYVAAPHYWYLVDALAYGFGFFLYCFVKRSYTGTMRLGLREWLWLSPALYYVGYLVVVFSMDGDTLVQSMDQPAFVGAFYGFVGTALLVNLGFLVETYHLLQQHPKHPYSKPFIVIGLMYAAVFFIWIVALGSSFLSDQHYWFNLTYYDLAFLTMAFGSLALSCWGYIQPNLYHLLTYGYQPQELDHLKSVAAQIETYVQNEQPYLNPSFSLTTIVDALGYNRSVVSKAINKGLGQPFSDWVNAHRVAHFLALATPEHLEQFTLLAIAEQAGFGSKVSFYKAFKKVKGNTPRAYLDAQSKKEVQHHHR